MLKQTHKSLAELAGSIPAAAKVIDVGGAAAPFSRANYIIDIQPYEDIHWNQAKGPGRLEIKKENYIQQDICARKAWPFPDNFFDYSYCSHTLEDIRDPIWVCSELARISKAGYIEVPSRLYETSFGIEARGLAGNCHHRWIIDVADEKLRFTFKYFFVHVPYINRNKKKYLQRPDSVLQIEWQDGFGYYENWLRDGRAIFEYYLGHDISDKKMWQLFRKTQDRNWLVKWLAYFKNTQPRLNSLFKKLKK